MRTCCQVAVLPIAATAVIQAKRYKNPVGVSAVRDLYGAVTNERAAKGILVSTGKYTAASYESCENKPLQLVNGNELLYLLGEQGFKAKIEFSESWKDPVTTRDD